MLCCVALELRLFCQRELLETPASRIWAPSTLSAFALTAPASKHTQQQQRAARHVLRTTHSLLCEWCAVLEAKKKEKKSASASLSPPRRRVGSLALAPFPSKRMPLSAPRLGGRPRARSAARAGWPPLRFLAPFSRRCRPIGGPARGVGSGAWVPVAVAAGTEPQRRQNRQSRRRRRRRRAPLSPAQPPPPRAAGRPGAARAPPARSAR